MPILLVTTDSACRTQSPSLTLTTTILSHYLTEALKRHPTWCDSARMLGLTVARAYMFSNASVKVTFVLNLYLTVSLIRSKPLSVRLTSSFIDGETHFRAHYTPTIHPETASALNISKFRTNRKILDASSLADAVRGCDTYVSQNVLRGRLSLAQVFSLLIVWHPCLISTKGCGTPRSGGMGQHLLPKKYLSPRGGDMLTSPCKISRTPQMPIYYRRS